jgi:aspartate/methionine/tyrosine aminotransferase
MVNPPKPGDVSYKQFMYEKDSLLNSLKRRARLMTDAFNALEGVTCQETEGVYLCLPIYICLHICILVFFLYIHTYLYM